MSGGSMDYICWKIEEYSERLADKELMELAKDMAKVFHDAEWWECADIGEGRYRKTVAEFKKKWFEASREERLLHYIDDAVYDLKLALGMGDTCNDCKNFEPVDDYGNCCYCNGRMTHKLDKVCKHFATKVVDDEQSNKPV